MREVGRRPARARFAGKLEISGRDLIQLQCQPSCIRPSQGEEKEGNIATVTTPPAEGRVRRKTLQQENCRCRCALKRTDVHSYSGIVVGITKDMHCSILRARANLSGLHRPNSRKSVSI